MKDDIKFSNLWRVHLVRV